MVLFGGHYIFPLLLSCLNLPIFVLDSAKYTLPRVFIFLSTIFVCLFPLFFTRIFPFLHKRSSFYINSRRVTILIIIFALTGTLGRFLIIKEGLYFQWARSIGRSDTSTWLFMLEKIPFYALVLSNLSYRITQIKHFKIFYVILLLMEVIYWLPAGRKEELFVALICPSLLSVSLGLQMKAVVKKVSVILLVIFFVVPMIRYYRVGMVLTENHRYSRGSIAELILGIPDVIEDGREVLNDTGDGYENIRRFSLVESLTGAIKLTDEEGYLYGRSYSFLGYFWIPRFIWQSKPSSISGQEFGRSIGLVSGGDSTSISISYIGEAWWNFSYFGVLIIILQLFLMNFLFIKAFYTKPSITNVLVYIIFLRTFIYYGGTIGPYFAGALKLIILLSPILFFIEQKRDEWILSIQK